MQHQAVVVSKEKTILHVRIVDGENCAGCSLASCCNAGNDEKKAVTVTFNPEVKNYTKGDMINIESVPRWYEHNIIWACIIPLIILVACIFTFIHKSDNTLGATIGVIIIAIYFLLLRTFKSSLKRTMRWKISQN